MSKAFWIRADIRTVEAVEYKTLADLQRMVGGFIESAWRNKKDDAVFVDEEGMFKYDGFFTIAGGHQPFAGNGVLVGRDRSESSKDYNALPTHDPSMTLAEVTSAVRFMSRLDAAKDIAL